MTELQRNQNNTEALHNFDKIMENNFPNPHSVNSFLHKLRLTLKMIKIQHSLFALPFALTSLLFATEGKPSLKLLILIIMAMVAARNTAMTFNRIVDRDIDKKNPRTKNREIPSGKLSLRFAKSFCLINAALFIALSALISKTCFFLSPVALAIVCGYSISKRYLNGTQFVLGLSLGIAPLATWIAAKNSISAFPAFLGIAVMLWVIGFDLIYSTLDYDFDKKNNLKNLVVKWGVKKSLSISRSVHFLSMLILFLSGAIHGLGLFYFLGCLVMTAIVIYEHKLVKPSDLSQVNMAFFTLNGYASLLFFGFVLLEIYFK